MKKFLFGAAVVAAAGFGTFTANQNNNQALLSDLQLDNVEVFGQGVEPDSGSYQIVDGKLMYVVEYPDNISHGTWGKPAIGVFVCVKNGVTYVHDVYACEMAVGMNNCLPGTYMYSSEYPQHH